MTLSVAHRRRSKSMHNADLQLTKKERLSYHDDDEAAIVPWVLGGDDYFLARADILAGLQPDKRASEAEEIAKNYAPYKRAHHRFIVTLLLLAAETPPALRQTRLVNSGRRSVWTDSDLDEFDGRRKRERWPTLKRGAERLALLGVNRCVECGEKLAASRRRTRPRVSHCAYCEQRYSSKVRDSHLSEIREALDAATGQRRLRRAARRQ
jgi:RNA polymerase-binding transcription factor DksA